MQSIMVVAFEGGSAKQHLVSEAPFLASIVTSVFFDFIVSRNTALQGGNPAILKLIVTSQWILLRRVYKERSVAAVPWSAPSFVSVYRQWHGFEMAKPSATRDAFFRNKIMEHQHDFVKDVREVEDEFDHAVQHVKSADGSSQAKESLPDKVHRLVRYQEALARDYRQIREAIPDPRHELDPKLRDTKRWHAHEQAEGYGKYPRAHEAFLDASARLKRLERRVDEVISLGRRTDDSRRANPSSSASRSSVPRLPLPHYGSSEERSSDAELAIRKR